MSRPALSSAVLFIALLCGASCQRPPLPAPLNQSGLRNEAYRLVLKDATTHVSARIQIFDQVREWRGPVNEVAPFVPASVYRKGHVVGRIKRADSIAATLGMLRQAQDASASGWGPGPVVVRLFEQGPAQSADSLQLVVVLDVGTPAEITWYRVVRKNALWHADRIGHFEF